MSVEVDTFASPRLTAERLRASHLADLLRMHADERVMATLGGVRGEAETIALLGASIEHWRRHGFGLWIFRDRASGELAGRGGLRHVDIGGTDEVELAYALLAPFWGRGIATEMGAAILEIGFDRLGLADIVCFTTTTNHASRRVIEKLGFRFERPFEHAGLPHLLHRLRRGERPRAEASMEPKSGAGSPEERFMRLAIDKARAGIAAGQSPFGACIVRGAEVVSCEHNVVWGSTDITAHAEVHAIRAACAKLGSIDLTGCTIYSTCEPCAMCFGACHWSHLTRIVYGSSIADAAAIGFHELSIPNDLMKKLGGSPVEVAGGFMAAECMALFEEWVKRGERKPY